MKTKNGIYLQALLLLMTLTLSQSLFSKYYRKCKLFKEKSGKLAQEINEQRVAIYPADFYIQPLIKTRTPLQYKQMDYFYLDYIGAGGSGEVYMVEDAQTHQPKIFKRFFKQKQDQFEEENFVMHRLNYSVEWTKDDLNGIPQKSDYEKDSNQHTEVPTIAIYPAKQSLTLRDVEFFPHEAAMIFYKIVTQLEKAHKSSLIHNDLKMGNVMVNSLGMNFKLFETQLIDWNLVTFYYKGFETNTRKGTTCYYSPEQLMKSSYLTPAIDIWALGVVMWTFFTEEKPFYDDCKQNNLRAIASLVGVQKLIQMHTKYRLPFTSEYYELLTDHIKDPQKYKQKSLRNAVPQDRQNFFTEDLLDIFKKMLTVDPEERITASQLSNHPFFRQYKKIPPMYREKRRVEEQKKKKKSGGNQK